VQTETIPLDETDCFSSSFINYISGDEKLKPFYRATPSIENFKEVIESRNFDQGKRDTLSATLIGQYEDLKVSQAVSENIATLKSEKTYTITTGHQLNIFTGPLYFIYKIITVINACKELKIAYPAYHFVPVYWMASEDHDFEEISYFHFEGRKITWETDQKGAVGRMDPAKLKAIAETLPSGADFFAKAYDEQSLAKAVRNYVNHLFGENGLVVIDADDQEMKKSFTKVIEDDLFTHSPEELVAQTSVSLESAGCKAQVHARQINFFYLKDGIRERIERSEDGFQVVDTDISFSEEEMRKLIREHPEQFSPNVALRPLYQEMILPNLAYVGGPSELVYWLQLKAVFDHFETSFPLLIPRNFALVCSKKDREKWEKTGLTFKDLFLESDKAHTKWVSSNSRNEISYQKELHQLQELEKQMQTQASKVDSTLVQHIEAIYTTFSKKIEKAEKKVLRAEKRKHEEKRAQIEAVKESLFPGGTLQERKANFLNFYLKDPQFIHKVMEAFDPFNYQMYLLLE